MSAPPSNLRAGQGSSERRSAGHAGSTPKSAFQTILFPPTREDWRAERSEQPECFIDLNLDQIVAAIVAKRDEHVLRPFFYSSYRNEEVVRYRQAVYADLELPEAVEAFSQFSDAMRHVRSNLAYADKMSYKRHKHMVILRAVWLYCAAVTSLLQAMHTLPIKSEGLIGLETYLLTYRESQDFRQLEMETAALREALSKLTYGMLFRGDKVIVRRYASEPDYAATVLDRFAKFRDGETEPPEPWRPKDNFSLNHIEEGILELVGNLFPEEYRRLSDYVARPTSFIDDVIARFEREIDFFVSYLEYIRPLKDAGLSFCLPDISTSTKETEAMDCFDLALAKKLSREKGTVVCNSFRLSDPERLIVISGPNQGGKTTFARMFGQLHFLARLGCPVPGKSARLFLPDHIFTHFEREEDISNLRGKLEDELVRLHHSLDAMTGDSIIILNEVFNSTSLDDQVFLSTKILEQILALDAIGVCVTFIDSLSRLSGKTVSMVSTVDAKDPARRTFQVVRKPADGLAYAIALAQKHRVTYEALRKRIHR